MTKFTENPSEEAVGAWARLIRVSQGLLSQVEADLKGAGFPVLSWYDALLELRRAGTSGLRPFQLQEQMLLAQYGLSRLVDRLDRAGYVHRMPNAQDGRGQVLRITPEGRNLLKRMWPVYRNAIQAHFAARISDRETVELAKILGKFRG